ncbi:MAG: acyl-CoA synthetase [Acidimicrobiia bacterium]
MLARENLLPNAVARWASTTPDTVALELVGGPRLTYAELHDAGLRWAGALLRVGVERGHHVATMVSPELTAHFAMLGVGWVGAVEVPLNTAYRGQTLHHALHLTDATTVVCSAEFVERIAEVAGDLPKLETVVVVDGTAPRGAFPGRVVDGTAFLDGVAPATGLPGPEYHHISTLLLTSGTTGPSKAVVLPWAGVFQMWSWVPDDALLPGEGLFIAMPLFHNSGRSGFNSCMARGGRYVTRAKFSGTSFWDDVRATDCRVGALVGPMTHLLYAAPPRADDADNPLRAVVIGPMIPEMADFERRFGVRVATCYGQTEIGAPLATGWDHGPWAGCGKPRTDYPWTECALVNELDEPVAPGEVGELVVRTREPWALNAGYYNMPEATAEAWRNGWFHTGDAFRCDEDGWYYFVDRMRDTIRRRGENISSFEVENAVLEFPGVVECAAVGIRTPLGDDEVMAAVIVGDADAFDPAALVGFLETRIATFMVPRYVEAMDDFPRNATTGRVRKHELRARGVTTTTWDRLADT